MVYEVPVSWTVCGSVRVEAESRKSAREIAADKGPCDVGNAEYLADSWIVDLDHEDIEVCPYCGGECPNDYVEERCPDWEENEG